MPQREQIQTCQHPAARAVGLPWRYIMALVRPVGYGAGGSPAELRVEE